eukprot:gnl/TRDRNA2_/TRDRNA2_136955_c0_seq1.p1 gnl/TRDRNA2_/TRDRNA2_136955_c0~~gnl/TRDRNA2_/TRDRNA2_136955_c0_seq1.p1  ORF type:complete len:417 (-),score=55.16 gnl/TRDRNA2_/TRDRNA2_136955_c0_seq1:162-1412(-)
MILRLHGTLCVILALVLPAVIHVLPHLVALCRHGRSDVLNTMATLNVLSNIKCQQERHLGISMFANAASYGPHSMVHEHISAKDIDTFHKEGYLVFKQLVPRDTAIALRDEIATKISTQAPLSWQGWIDSDALLDFLLFGPLGALAARLLDAKAIHLLHSQHVFTRARQPEGIARLWHFDLQPADAHCYADAQSAKHGISMQCGERCRSISRSRINIWASLQDEMPALWLANETTAATVAASATGKTKWKQHEIPHTSPLASHLDEVSMKPVVDIGDVIAYSPCVMHRAPVSCGVERAYLRATYGCPDATFRGKFVGHGRLCDSGIKQGLPVEQVPSVANAPRPECFPQVWPASVLDGKRGTSFPLSFQCESPMTPFKWYAQGWADNLADAMRGPCPLASFWAFPRCPGRLRAFDE